MTSAARPTWKPKAAGSEAGGSGLHLPSRSYSSRDLPAHKELKVRRPGQGTSDDIRHKDFRAELEEKERKATGKKRDREEVEEERREKPRLEAEPVKAVEDNPFPQDADDEDDHRSASSSDEASDDGSDDDEDETAELMRELEKIRKEREEEARRKEMEQSAEEQRARQEAMLHGNPLLSDDANSYSLRKRWDDDVVFRNQSRTEIKPKKRFINDTVRSDFHKKFLTKYIQ
eukprot:GILJ01009959.1.p1 GENE.GILJ01009959.1~~GILJ01009959.1.p1  ORF type:complete len:243 (-),score=61.52 GILJ01009959.1:21-713(-)